MIARFAFALLAGGLLAVSASAQDDPPPSETDPDLRCTIWAGATLNLATDPELRNGMVAAFTFFMGRFEGRTGEAIEQAMTPEVIARETSDMPALTQFCLPQLSVLSDRLNNFSTELDKLHAGGPTEQVD
ncbi:MAG: hypothetical protein IE933_05660 [Sphingomonadales bacterium]|nr:hypothetical protein [Sphingomonadales bacterium]MBD3773453.1 hypothetical protein [Paracoccaceae bacterium]